MAQGGALESVPTAIDRSALERFWQAYPILVLPGFYGTDNLGRTALFGRGGSDLSALFLAAELEADCRLLKDVRGVFNADPVRDCNARRFAALRWSTAIEVAGPLVQPKALRYAQLRARGFDVGRPNERACTGIGRSHDSWAAKEPPSRPLRIALLGCGVVGRGVYDIIKRHPDRFEVSRVFVRDPAKYPDIAERTADAGFMADESIDGVIECLGGVELPYSFIDAALAAGKFVITANKAVVAARWAELSMYARARNSGQCRASGVHGARGPRHSQRHLRCGVGRLGRRKIQDGGDRAGASSRFCRSGPGTRSFRT